MIDFTRIKHVYLTERVLPETYARLGQAGRRHQEAFVLWAGVFLSADEFIVSTAVYPQQTAFATANGVGVQVDGTELSRLARWLFENGQTLVAQVHSHPTEAYHSDTDDGFPMVTAAGQFSIVVPNFARGPQTLSTCAVYRLSTDGGWTEVPVVAVQQIFKDVK